MMKTSTLMADEPLAELTTSPTLPQVHLNAEGLAELYSFFCSIFSLSMGLTWKRRLITSKKR